MKEKITRQEPTIYIAPEIVDIRALEFYRAEEVFDQARPAAAEFKKRLSQALSL